MNQHVYKNDLATSCIKDVTTGRPYVIQQDSVPLHSHGNSKVCNSYSLFHANSICSPCPQQWQITKVISVISTKHIPYFPYLYRVSNKKCHSDGASCTAIKGKSPAEAKLVQPSIWRLSKHLFSKCRERGKVIQLQTPNLDIPHDTDLNLFHPLLTRHLAFSKFGDVRKLYSASDGMAFSRFDQVNLKMEWHPINKTFLCQLLFLVC